MAPFGVAEPQLLIVGLAPGMHGANRTGRPFTGDYAGILLYESLHELGLSTAPTSVDRSDGLQAARRAHHQCREVPAAREQAAAGEIQTCNQYLAAELEKLTSVRVVLALGRSRTRRC